MRYAIWNNKGGVGKSFLSFVLGTELARINPDKKVVLVDMCPQANLSEIVLGGNGTGSKALDRIIHKDNRKTVGGYFDTRITSPHAVTGEEHQFLVQAQLHNKNVTPNLYLICGDPSLELQAQVINQIGAQTLPEDAWKNVHNWLKDLAVGCAKHLGETITLIDCNPSFSAYTELSMMAAARVIIPCSSDGSSARAIDNVGSLLYGIGNPTYTRTGFHSKADQNKMQLPLIHSVVLNRSTQYNKKASKAFGAMFEEIKRRVDSIQLQEPQYFCNSSATFCEIPDNHSVAIVCSHLGRPLYSINSGRYEVHSTSPQINPEPLNRYKDAVDAFIQNLV